MKSPRHRWNCVAQPLGLAYQRDGLTSTVTPDNICKELKKVVTGKGRNKAIERAYEIYRTDSARVMYESVLLNTLDIAQSAKIIGERENYLQTYSECFFDIKVFESPADKMVYLDRFARLNPDHAQTMRNMLTVTTDELLFLADKRNAEKVDPKTALETGLKLYYWMMKSFIQPQLEQIVIAGGETNKINDEHFDKMFNRARVCAQMVQQFSDLLLRYELDKSADSFLEEFALGLIPKPNTQLIADKATEGKDPPIY